MENKVATRTDWQTWAKRVVSVVIIGAAFWTGGYYYAMKVVGVDPEAETAGSQAEIVANVVGEVVVVNKDNVSVRTVGLDSNGKTTKEGTIVIGTDKNTRYLKIEKTGPVEAKAASIKKGTQVSVVLKMKAPANAKAISISVLPGNAIGKKPDSGSSNPGTPETINGKIKEVTEGQITIDANGVVMVITIDSNTSIRKSKDVQGQKPGSTQPPSVISLTEIAVGDSVSVACLKQDGTYRGLGILVLPGG